MTGTVLCAVDVADGTRDTKVIQQAARMADMEGAQLDVITVVPDYGMSVVGSHFTPDHHDKMVSESKTHLNELVTRAIGAEGNAKVRHIVATGRAYDEILRVAKADGASLIVIGAHKPDLKDYLLGPNAARVVRHSDCSVLVVR